MIIIFKYTLIIYFNILFHSITVHIITQNGKNKIGDKMRQFIKRILYCFIFFFTFLLLMYIIAFCVGKPELNKDRYIKLYDDQNKIFYQSVNNYSGQYVSIDDVSPYFFFKSNCCY